MGKNKLARFAEMATFPNTYEYPQNIAGTWHQEVFKNKNDIVLELACGRGEYTLGLAELFPDKNFIGIDRKGARIWRGAKTATESNINNVAFLRTDIEQIDQYFAPSEISEIWITFPDPFPAKGKARKRLTAPLFTERYKKFLKHNGVIHLKTDSDLLYNYTQEIIAEQDFKIIQNIADIYGLENIKPEWNIKTYYENKWLEQGIKSKLISFCLHS